MIERVTERMLLQNYNINNQNTLQVEEMKEIHMKFRITMGTVAAGREKEVELVLEILRDSRQQDTVHERVKRPVPH